MVDGHSPLELEAGSFLLLPSTPAFALQGFQAAAPRLIDPHTTVDLGAEVRHGDPNAPAEVRLLGGHFRFEAEDAGLLVALLPAIVHVRGVERLTSLVRMLDEEARDERVGQTLVMFRLVEVLLVEALRSLPERQAAPGLLRGLADRRVATALRDIHGDPAQPWTVVRLARSAGLSRSAFFDRFAQSVGLTPMAYLTTWRMAIAKRLLRRGHVAIDSVAEQVGYASASTFSTAFRRHVGQSPGRYAREHLVGVSG